MRFELLTLSGTKFNDEIIEVIVPTAAGAIAVLENHEPLTTIVVPGTVTIKPKKGENETFTTYGGVLEVSNKSCRLLSDESEHSDELVEQEVEAALAKAQGLREAAKDKHELAYAQSLVDRHTVRLNVARMKRRHPRSEKRADIN